MMAKREFDDYVKIIKDKSDTEIERLRDLKFAEIEDIVGVSTSWPHFMKALFTSKHLSHWNRVVFSAFAFVNGLNPIIVQEYLIVLNNYRPWSEIREIRSLLRAFEHCPRNYSTTYAFNVSSGKYEYIDGRLRVYKPKAER